MSEQNTTTTRVTFPGCSVVGMLLAGWCSYMVGNSPIWIAIHAVFGWFYLLYLCAGCGGGLPSELFTPMK